MLELNYYLLVDFLFVFSLPDAAMSSLGGLYTSIVVKYTDNIVKGFSTAVSIIMAALGSFIIFQTHFGIYFYIGTFLVVGAIYIYSLPKPQPKPVLPQTTKETV